MKVKRIGAFLSAAALAAGVLLPAVPVALPAAALPVRSASDQYFGRQLAAGSDRESRLAKIFYDALVTMHEQGTFLTGTQPYTVSALTQQDLADYPQEQALFTSAFSTARDAFYVDYPDLFYLDFNNLALYVSGASGSRSVAIGMGRRGNSYLIGDIRPDTVSGLIAGYDAALKALTDAARGEGAGESDAVARQAAQVRYVHDAIIQGTAYKLDDVCGEANRPYIRTAYGALVNGVGVCEAYARAFKSAMDTLDIPCVLVEGTYRHTEQMAEPHLWACVQLGEAWYGVDPTMDDNGNGKAPLRDYLLAGAVTMDARHAPDTTMSAAGYEFRYPTLTQNDYYTQTVHSANGLVVRYDPDGTVPEMEEGGGSGTFYVSYKGMGCAAAAKQGYYMLARFSTVDSDTGEWNTSDWGYVRSDLYPLLAQYDTATEMMFPVSHVMYVEFGVTDIKPGELGGDAAAAGCYQGDPLLLLATSGMQENPNGSYQAPPYVKRVTPTESGRLEIGRSYHVTATYDKKLVLTGAAAPGLEVESYYYQKGKRIDNQDASRYYTVSQPTLSEDGLTVEFDFTPSTQWGDDTVFYTFTLTGVAGESGKAPNSITYLASYPCSVYAYQAQGFDWNVYAKAALMDDPDAWDMSTWQAADHERLAEELKHCMTLVVSDTTRSQTQAMKDELQSEAGIAGSDVIATYNISLTLCKSQIVHTGERLRVMLGFPEGYSADDVGVTYKAYHYTKNDRGEIVSAEPIECIVTPYGLLVLCDSFSPFAIVRTAGSAAGEKSVIVTAGAGGCVDADAAAQAQAVEDVEGLYTMPDGAIQTYTIKADEGYAIESISITQNGKTRVLPVSNSARESVTLSEADMGAQSAIIDARFRQLPQKASVSIAPALAIEAGQALAITPTVSDGVYAYQWYKDDAALPEQTSAALHIDSAAATDAGRYTLEVTSFAGLDSIAVKSGACVVTVNAAAAKPTATPAGGATTQPTATPAATAEPQPTAAPQGGTVPQPTLAPGATAAPDVPFAPAATRTPTPPSCGTTPKATPTATPDAAGTAAGPAVSATPNAATPTPTISATPAPTPEKTGGSKVNVPVVAGVFVGAGAIAAAALLLPRRKKRGDKGEAYHKNDYWNV